VVLKERGISRLYVSGLATDYCVKESVLEGIRHGLSVTLLIDATRGVDLHPGDSAKAIEEMTAPAPGPPRSRHWKTSRPLKSMKRSSYSF